ncbi:hypothetical protein B2M27_09960 [Kluyvera intermedia]|uniref:Uncharacterized protein n=1 Tax=Kluyvera intermedia TaxID=61648 RepID=A0ABX3UGF8_KLUIN|nr:hypothetical protein B2M27_09960 [Kluyvera intermedia]
MTVNQLILKWCFAALKTGDPKGFQSSNLCASARLNKGLPFGRPFVFLVLNTFIKQITVTPIELTMG